MTAITVKKTNRILQASPPHPPPARGCYATEKQAQAAQHGLPAPKGSMLSKSEGAAINTNGALHPSLLLKAEFFFQPENSRHTKMKVLNCGVQRSLHLRDLRDSTALPDVFTLLGCLLLFNAVE